MTQFRTRKNGKHYPVHGSNAYHQRALDRIDMTTKDPEFQREFFKRRYNIEPSDDRKLWFKTKKLFNTGDPMPYLDPESKEIYVNLLSEYL